MPPLRARRLSTPEKEETGDVIVEAIDTIRLGQTWRYIQKGARFPITDPIVRQAPHLFEHPARPVTPEEVSDAQ